MKTCKDPLCGRTFEASFGQQRYCRVSCRDQAQRQRHPHRPVTRRCRNESCGRRFDAYFAQRRYCSKSCRTRARYKPHPRDGNLTNLAGRRFGRLTVLHSAGPADLPHSLQRWVCRCDSPAHAPLIVPRPVPYHLLTGGSTCSCGCLRRETAAANSRRSAARRRQHYAALPEVRKACVGCGAKFCARPRRQLCPGCRRQRGRRACRRWYAEQVALFGDEFRRECNERHRRYYRTRTAGGREDAP